MREFSATRHLYVKHFQKYLYPLIWFFSKQISPAVSPRPTPAWQLKCCCCFRIWIQLFPTGPKSQNKCAFSRLHPHCLLPFCSQSAVVSAPYRRWVEELSWETKRTEEERQVGSEEEEEGVGQQPRWLSGTAVSSAGRGKDEERTCEKDGERRPVSRLMKLPRLWGSFKARLKWERRRPVFLLCSPSVALSCWRLRSGTVTLLMWGGGGEFGPSFAAIIVEAVAGDDSLKGLHPRQKSKFPKRHYAFKVVVMSSLIPRDDFLSTVFLFFL